MRILLLTLALLIPAPAALAGSAPPTTRTTVTTPTTTRGARPAMDAGAVAMLKRARHGIDQIKLTAEQQAKVDTVFDEARAELEQMKTQLHSMEMRDRQIQVREFFDGVRAELAFILTPEQREKLRELMRAPATPPTRHERDHGEPNPSTRPRPSPRAGAGAGARGGDQMSEMTMSAAGAGAGAGAGDEMMSMEAASRPKEKSAGSADGGDTSRPAPGPAVGDVAPDFALTKLDGAQIQLASVKGRVIVLVFGSYSAPTFRNRAAALEKLHSDVGARATVFVVYGREAHATGEWEVARNKADGIRVEQANSIESRKSAASTAREKLKLTTPILLDTLDNATATAYGAGINSAYVIGRDGRIAARQQWFEPIALRRAIDAAAVAKPATRPAP